LAETARFSVKVFATLGKKPLSRWPRKSDIEIMERLEGIEQGIYIAIKKEALLIKGLCLWLTNTRLFAGEPQM
jgi:hypothetical protein